MAKSTDSSSGNKGKNQIIKIEDLPVTNNYYYSNQYKLVLSNTSIEMVFGNGSSLFNNNLMTAIQVMYPLEDALDPLYNLVYVQPSVDGTQTYYETLSHVTKDARAEDYTIKALSQFVPTTSNFKIVNSNFAGFAYANGEAMIEFFVASPRFIHGLSQGKKQNSSIHPVFALIASKPMIRNFLKDLKDLLDEAKERTNIE